MWQSENKPYSEASRLFLLCVWTTICCCVFRSLSIRLFYRFSMVYSIEKNYTEVSMNIFIRHFMWYNKIISQSFLIIYYVLPHMSDLDPHAYFCVLSNKKPIVIKLIIFFLTCALSVQHLWNILNRVTRAFSRTIFDKKREWLDVINWMSEFHASLSFH